MFALPTPEYLHRGGPSNVRSAEGWGWGAEGRDRDEAGMTQPRGSGRRWLLTPGTTPQGSSNLCQCFLNHELPPCSGRKVTNLFLSKRQWLLQARPKHSACWLWGWRLEGRSLWPSWATLALPPSGLRADPAMHSWFTGPPSGLPAVPPG